MLSPFTACSFVCFHNSAYPSERGARGQAFTFTRDRARRLDRSSLLGAKVGSAQGPTDLGKYLMRSGEVFSFINYALFQ